MNFTKRLAVIAALSASLIGFTTTGSSAFVPESNFTTTMDHVYCC